MHWKDRGTDPDYRFSLANERTFLAWIRTALAFLAGAVILWGFASAWSDSSVLTVASAILALIATVVGASAYFRWRNNELAMRLQQALPSTSLIAWLAGVVALLGAVSALLLFKIVL